MTETSSADWYSHISRLIKKRPQLNVYSSGDYAGVLAKESVYAFTYDVHVQSNKPCEVSLGLPFRTRSYTSGDLFGVFSMNEPEGYLRLYIEDAMSRAGIPNKLLFLALSQGLQVGRVSYEHPELDLAPPSPETIEQLLHERDQSYFGRLMAKYALRSSLSGAQPKIIVPTQITAERPNKTSLLTPSVIVKEAGHEFPGLSLNEYFCMSVASEANLNVPRFWLSDDATRFIVERFDRDPSGKPLGFEDMAVLAGLSASQKYMGSYESIMRIVNTYCANEAANQTMFERIALSALLKDGDAHLKNFGLVYEDPSSGILPSPVYDVVCTAIYPDLDRELALKMNKLRTFPSPDNLIKFAQKFGVEKEFAWETINRIEHAIDLVIDQLSQDARFKNDPNKTLTKMLAILRP
ncbi:MAG TPA: type II toxin-antitoxin system HipA family toxin [Pusillimonas sp.]|jgi:serine/threonine-protein kinase HipA|nr:hypothetical protein [Pusillimonas sp.]MBC43122.1 hypothetical protein [Pusillimonas sp.]HBT33061.1 type II toxin-antitoxin system HipA family toxin [Pusillimonas sp.]HCN72256.1 type II toxin-antitoxin system HipA family toxin [Pusillimonas sp.]HCP79356.1 type II toxin-antitoxin system HipA family toxin [Pusillimonas sp.]|tara:strand:+ start:69802 stop:71025 length:1224 start_codon:yes stop_codon:yes gene_type:complete